MEMFGNLLKQASEMDALTGMATLVGVIVVGVILFKTLGFVYDLMTSSKGN